MISLLDAVKQGRLEDFIAQEEGRKVASISEVAFNETASIVIKTPLQADQTSCSPHRDGSPEK